MSMLAGEALAEEKHFRDLQEAELRVRAEKRTEIPALGNALFGYRGAAIEDISPLQAGLAKFMKGISRSQAIAHRESLGMGLSSAERSTHLVNHLMARRIVQLHEQGPFLQESAFNHLIALRKAAASKDHREFSRLARAIKWSGYAPCELTRAIDLALALDMVQVARGLALEGHKLFPHDERIQQAAAVLSPPFFVRKRPIQATDFEISQQWLQEHATHYKGQWVAVCAGILLGSASTLTELYQRIGPQRRRPNTIIVKVLS